MSASVTSPANAIWRSDVQDGIGPTGLVGTLREMDPSTGSEDFSDIPVALGVPFRYWIFGGFDPGVYSKAVADGTVTDVTRPTTAETSRPSWDRRWTPASRR